MYMTKMKLMDKYDAVKTLLDGGTVENFSVEDAQAFIDERKALVVKKNSSATGERKPTKTQLENEGVKETILATLADIGTPASILDIQKANETLATLSNQKLSALLKQLRASELIDRTEVKGKPHYAVR